MISSRETLIFLGRPWLCVCVCMCMCVCVCVHTSTLSHLVIQLFATPWTVACQAPLFLGFPGKNTRVGWPFILQGIFPTRDLTQVSVSPVLETLYPLMLASLVLRHTLSQMITLGQTNWIRAYQNSLYYLCNFSVNPKLF